FAGSVAASRLDFGEVGDVREQPEGQVLLNYEAGIQTACGRRRVLAAAGGRDGPGVRFSHGGLKIEDNIKQGMSAEEARRRALISLGGMDVARELHRESRGLPVLETILQDVRYSIRTLRRDAGLATFAISTERGNESVGKYDGAHRTPETWYDVRGRAGGGEGARREDQARQS